MVSSLHQTFLSTEREISHKMAIKGSEGVTFPTPHLSFSNKNSVTPGSYMICRESKLITILPIPRPMCSVSVRM